jgi:putative transposase
MGTDLISASSVEIVSWWAHEIQKNLSLADFSSRWLMPRTARVVLPAYPHHVVQRGHNQQVCFADSCDYERYLATLAKFKGKLGVKVYAWCLMTNHVHLLLEPSNATSLGLLMKRLAGRQTRYHNRLERRSGTLWEGRYKSSLVQNEGYLLACCRYIELNPVRSRMVAAAQDYPWSSCRARLGYARSAILDLDPCYQGLATDESARRERYGEFLQSAIPEGEWALIRTAVQRGQLTGNEAFSQQVAAILHRRIENRGPGRPARK